MRIRNWQKLWGTLFAAVPAVAVGVSQAPSAFAEDAVEGKVVEISPQGDAETSEVEGEEATPAFNQPKYWIGLQGRPIDSAVLRTQLQLADDVGVVIENVVPDSPAAKAGLRQHDLLIAVNGEPITDLGGLQKVVAEVEAKPIELKIIRLAKEESLKVTPEETPADAFKALAAQQGRNPLGMMAPNGDFRGLMEQLQGRGLGGLQGGAGAMFGQQFDRGVDVEVPNGVQISVSRNGEGPSTITVTRGEETWTIEEGDKEALAQLPDDLRPIVEQMLHGQQLGLGAMPNFNFGELRNAIPEELRQFGAGGNREGVDRAHERLLERLERMEQRIKELQEELDHDAPAEEAHGTPDRST